jgi:SAM-dependent methyltransferase
VDRKAVRKQLDEVAARHGDWTAHDIFLGDGVSTLPALGPDLGRLRRVVQLVADLTGRPLSALRVLDLGALEGHFAVEFALHGAEVVAIEGRETNAAKARVAAEVLGLDKLEVRVEDVRGLSPERHGTFDVVLCLGLLYHLDGDDLFPFIDRLAEVCGSLLILDTHVGLSRRDHHRHDGHDYWGVTFVEHSPQASAGQRERLLWASLDNEVSFWPTRASLLNALQRSGFTSVLECGVPAMPRPRDRVTFAALRGSPVELRSVSIGGDAPAGEVPEQFGPRWIRNQSRLFLFGKRIALRLLAARDRHSSTDRPRSSRAS